MKKFLFQFSRIFVGVLFIISGLIKLNDPIGTAIKLEEYFEVFSLDFFSAFAYLIPASLYFAVILVVFEVVLGIALLINYRFKLSVNLLLALIVFFSFLTFYSAFFNKVTDCGCFGDALKLTPWQSFGKDMILLFFLIILYKNQKQAKSIFSSPIVPDIIMLVFTAISFYTAIFVINHLPFIDFRPYKVGNNIPALMLNSEPLKYSYKMEKEGKEFSFDQYPEDTTYTFKAMELLNKDALPKITDYRVWSDSGDFTAETFKGKKLFITVRKTESASTQNSEKIKTLISQLKNTQIAPIILSATEYSQIDLFRMEQQWAAPYYYIDGTVLKTIMRSDPGLWLLDNGTVKGKWHHNDTPSLEEVKRSLD